MTRSPSPVCTHRETASVGVCVCVCCVRVSLCVRPSVRVCIGRAKQPRKSYIPPLRAPCGVIVGRVSVVRVCVCTRVCGRARKKKTGSDGVCVGLKGPTSGAPNETRLLFDSISPSLQLPPLPLESRSQLARGEQNCIVCVCVFIFSSLVCYSGEGKIQKGNTVPRGRARASFTNFLPRNHAKRQHQLPNVQSTANLNCCQVRVHSSTARDCSTNDGTSSNTTALSYQFASLRFFVPSSIDHSPSQSTQSKCRNQ